MPTPDRLSTRHLNRATLARQMLLRREPVGASQALERLVGMQAQAPNAPYVGLWTRLQDFDPGELAKLLLTRRAVRIALMRSTIHLVTARDCLALRPLLQPVILRSAEGGHGRELAGIDRGALAAAGRRLVDEAPLTFVELGARLGRLWPGRRPESLAQGVRALVPLVQIPPRGVWEMSGAARHMSAEAWLGRPMTAGARAERMLERYLAAFGPASLRDAQVWSGLALREAAERLRRKLRAFRDQNGRELLDLADAPRPDPAEPAEPRFLPEYDNVLLAYADRSRIVADEHRAVLFSRNGIIAPTLLVDGTVTGTCAIRRSGRRAILTITLLKRLPRRQRPKVVAEGMRLLAFVAATREHDVQFVG